MDNNPVSKVDVVLVAVGKPEQGRFVVEKTGAFGPASFFVDPDRVAYKAMGLLEDIGVPVKLDNYNFFKLLLNPFTAFAELQKGIAKLSDVMKGYDVTAVQPKDAETVKQQGGTFLIDKTGRLVYAFKDRVPNEHPEAVEVLARLGISRETAVA
uniref:Alkyl hydroperoxide reductase subunit C/ Thiol specific antioxidant domain-containing protein n=1 Tax=Chromera velia CCMP2878 TaxID=1169474 RepID=A0A0G4FIZ9_9ALVE|mmetsp:Transcript_10581/g.20533  ORF Transcript_10581/g.20533 Transcript_10581/m.20533 type:complete len:154 (-) Transcript_10581:1354-1815(-)|eukprot:Cvel_17182.t1-p1 / transcript=Cvel_17182.t1 / gene=Cvel_17182 / organism=Chromera_velia_CCMP2878 / gene_product=hypothetical protein / transcript_product=hypothetical protein / location=Cvel_scaffold1357:29624-31780(-) / protein_length=153 / sequence_SO=supercontig / SO=protein_coding / is_pseudo=false